MRAMVNVRQPVRQMIGRMFEAFRMREEPEYEESEEVFDNDTGIEVSQGWDGVSQARDGVSQEPEEASQEELWDGPSGVEGVPEIAANPLWWAKAARNVSWKGQRPVRIAISAGGAVAAILVGATVGGTAAVFFGVAALTIFLIADPIQLFCRRIAIQTRALISIGAWLAAFLIWRPSVPAAVTLGIYAALAAVLIRLGNNQWVVEANYCSSRELYMAFRANPAESAHQALRTKESTIYTYWYEMGVPPKDPLSWALACGTFCLGWLSGKKNGQSSLAEDDRHTYEKRLRAIQRELADARKKAGEADEWMERALDAEKALKAETYGKGQMFDLRDRLTAEKEELKKQLSELEKAYLEKKDDGYREKLLWYEYHALGNRSVREISRNTGIPKSTVQRWVAKQKEEEGDREQIPGDGREDGEE